MRGETTVYLAEAIGTMILVILGNGVVANVLLNRTKGQNSGWMVITTGWGLAVTVAVYSVGRISGAHINPAVTFGLASIGAFPWSQVPGYLLAQMLGAVLGAVIVYLVYFPHWAETEDSGAKLAAFCTAPAISNRVANFVTEVIATAMLLFGILAISANSAGFANPGEVDLSVVFRMGLQPLLVGLLVWSIGLSLGGDRRVMPLTPPATWDRALPTLSFPFKGREKRTGGTVGFPCSPRFWVAFWGHGSL